MRRSKSGNHLALGRLKTGQLNKTEQAYADRLRALQHAGEILWHRFEGIKLRLMPFASILGEMKAKGLPVMVLSMGDGDLYLADRAEENREVIAGLNAGPNFRAALDPRRLISALSSVDSNVIALHTPESRKKTANWLLYEDQGDHAANAHLTV